MRNIYRSLFLLALVSAFTARATVYTFPNISTAPLPGAREVELKFLNKEPWRSDVLGDFSCLSGEIEVSAKFGYVSFWFKPNFDSDDGKDHSILTIGDLRDGMALAKTGKGLLKISSSSRGKTAASRSAVSFKAGEWHHIAFAWFTNDEGVPCGLPLFFDKECVAGEVPGKEAFFDSESSAYTIDVFSDSGEYRDLVFRNEKLGKRSTLDNGALLRTVYTDYFRSFPAEAIEITHEPWGIHADKRILLGYSKKFGLRAKRNGKFEMVTDEMNAYGNWSYFDAKPFIQWSTDNGCAAPDEKIPAAIKGLAEGKDKVKASYRGKEAEFATEVISPEKPDMTVQFIELLPRYSYKDLKTKIAPGDQVTSVVHVANYGPITSPAGLKLRFWVGDEKAPVCKRVVELEPFLPQQIRKYSFIWTFPKESLLMNAEVKLDDDLCLVNNKVSEWCDARPLWFAFSPMVTTNYFRERKMNCVGSFSMFDWVAGHKLKLDALLLDTKYPDICPDGIKEKYRIDNLVYHYWEKDKDNVYFKMEEYRDGGFPITDNPNDRASHQASAPHFSSLNASVVHELGHTCLALPDVYSYPVRWHNVLLKDKEGKYYAGGSRMPKFGSDIMYSSAENVPCGSAYTPLMSGCHMWINRSNAGKIVHCSGYRGPRFWGVQGRFIPISENILKIYDVNDEPLRDAAVYIYHVAHGKINAFADKYFADIPKFKGYTDKEGKYLIPTDTDKNWDSVYTDRFDGRTYVWNPFGMTTDENDATKDAPSTPSVWHVEGLLLIKIETEGDVEFHLLPLSEFNEQFFAGDGFRGVYEIRTQLVGTKRPALRETVIPKACRFMNLAPVALLETNYFKAKAGTTITVDASDSYDPEGQPLLYYWHDAGNWYAVDFRSGMEQEYKVPAKKGEKIKKALYVLDGIRASELFEFTIEAE